MLICLKRGFIFVVFGIYFFLCIQHGYAATLGSVSDTISTSRPSASNVLNADQAASATQVSVVDLGPSASSTIYLASDSAIFLRDTGETQNAVNVASMSGQVSGT